MQAWKVLALLDDISWTRFQVLHINDTVCPCVDREKQWCVCVKRTNKKWADTHLPTLTSGRRCSYPTKHIISHLISQKDNSMLLCKETIDEANNNIPPCFLPHNMSLCQTVFSLAHVHFSSTFSPVRQHLCPYTCSTCCKSLFSAITFSCTKISSKGSGCSESSAAGKNSTIQCFRTVI